MHSYNFPIYLAIICIAFYAACSIQPVSADLPNLAGMDLQNLGAANLLAGLDLKSMSPELIAAFSKAAQKQPTEAELRQEVIKAGGNLTPQKIDWNKFDPQAALKRFKELTEEARQEQELFKLQQSKKLQKIAEGAAPEKENAKVAEINVLKKTQARDVLVTFPSVLRGYSFQPYPPYPSQSESEEAEKPAEGSQERGVSTALTFQFGQFKDLVAGWGPVRVLNEIWVDPLLHTPSFTDEEDEDEDAWVQFRTQKHAYFEMIFIVIGKPSISILSNLHFQYPKKSQ
jgi:hypothetical protein